MAGFWKYAQEDPGLPRDRRPRRHRAHRRRRARPRQPGRARAALARFAAGRHGRRGAAERPSPDARVPRGAAGRLVLRADQLPALAARGRVHPPGLRREGVRQPRALRRRSRARPPTKPASRPSTGSRTGRSPGSGRSTKSSTRSRRRCPTNRATGAAMHYTSGTTGKPKGVKRALAEHRPRHERGAVHVPARPVRHHARRRQRAPLHVAELPHRGHDVRRQRAALEAHGRVHGPVGPRRGAAPHRALPRARTRTWCRRSSSACCSCPTRREAQVRRVVDEVGDPRRRAVPGRRPSARCSSGGAR